MKHTPGPWICRYDPPEVLMGGNQRSWRVFGQLPPWGPAQHVADCYDYQGSKGNAQFIAIAPELYEALEECFDALAVISNEGTGVGAYAYHKAKAAIAKVKGE